MSLSENIKFLREQRKISQAELADALGKGQTTIQKIESGQTENPRFLPDIAKFFGVEEDALRYKDLTKQSLKPITSDIGGTVEMHLWSRNDPLPDDEFAYLPFYKDVEFQGGSGCFPTEDHNGYKLAFAKSTLYRYNVSPKDAVMVSMTGDSMEPVIPPGSTIGINMGEKRIMDGQIYAINHGGLLRIKRLYRQPNGYVRINSYNHIEHPDESVLVEEIEVVGKVFTWQVMV